MLFMLLKIYSGDTIMYLFHRYSHAIQSYPMRRPVEQVRTEDMTKPSHRTPCLYRYPHHQSFRLAINHTTILINRTGQRDSSAGMTRELVPAEHLRWSDGWRSVETKHDRNCRCNPRNTIAAGSARWQAEQVLWLLSHARHLSQVDCDTTTSERLWGTEGHIIRLGRRGLASHRFA
jgi:hypothetical protein